MEKSYKMDIKSDIRKKLNEINMEQLYGDMKRRKAQVLGLSHVAYDTYEDKQGNKYVWDKVTHSFKQNHFANMIKPDTKKDDSNMKILGIGGKTFDTEKEAKEYIEPLAQAAKKVDRENTPSNLVKSINDIDVEDYEIEEIKEPKGHGWRSSLLKGKGFGILAKEDYHDTYFRVYDGIDNIGRKGKTVKETDITLTVFQSRYAWKSTIVDRIKKAKPKTADEAIAIIKAGFEEAIAKEGKGNSRERTEVLKGVDRHIPDFGTEGDYSDAIGDDVRIEFRKGGITFTSKSDSEEADKGHMRTYTEVNWSKRKKIAALKDKLVNVKGLGAVHRILMDAGIKFDHRYHIQGGWD